MAAASSGPAPLATAAIDSPVGSLTLVASAAGLAAVLWREDEPGRVPLGVRGTDPSHPVLVQAACELGEYFAGRRTRFDVAIDMAGTPFQQRVWAALVSIPYGETRSYAEIARAIGEPAACRAVGAANARNPVSIIVPCHRAIGSGGALTGFAGGIDAKRRLLALESGQMELCA